MVKRAKITLFSVLIALCFLFAVPGFSQAKAAPVVSKEISGEVWNENTDKTAAESLTMEKHLDRAAVKAESPSQANPDEEKLRAKIAEAEEVLKRNLKEQYAKQLKEVIELAKGTLANGDQAAYGAYIQAMTNLLANADANTIKENPQEKELKELVAESKKILDRNLKKEYADQLAQIVDMAEEFLAKKDESAYGQYIQVLKTLNSQADANTIKEESVLEDLQQLVKDGEGLLEKNLKEDYRKDLEKAVESGKKALQSKEIISASIARDRLHKLLGQADANITTDAEYYEPVLRPITVTAPRQPIPVDAIANQDQLPEKIKVQFVDQPQEIYGKEQSIPAIVKYPDDSEDKITIRLTIVKGSTEEEKEIEGTKISIISDTHVFPREMIYDNEEYRKALNSDRKLLTESTGILDSAISLIEKNGSLYVFVTGDLTKDGEYLSHQYFAKKMEELAKQYPGRRIFVVPGNHDINNLHGYNFNSDGKGTTAPAKRTSPDDFLAFYDSLVYSQALAKYKDSPYFKEYLAQVNQKYQREKKYRGYAHGYTSYVSRVDLDSKTRGENGLTIIGLDTAHYSIDDVKDHKDGHQETEGSVSIAQLKWIKDVAMGARKRNDVVMVLAHHAFIPHFYKQEEILKPYILDNWNVKIQDKDSDLNGKTPAEVLTALGIHFLFTGHMHSQDIARVDNTTLQQGEGKVLYDIETGSTVTYPMPVRHLVLQHNPTAETPNTKLQITTEHIPSFEFTNLAGRKQKVENAEAYSAGNMITSDLVENVVTNYLLPQNNQGAKGLVYGLLNWKEGQGEAKQLMDTFQGLLGSKDQPRVMHMQAMGQDIQISLYVTSSKEGEGRQLNIDVEAKLGTLKYYIPQEQILEFLNHTFAQLDAVLFKNPANMNKWVHDIARRALNTKVDAKRDGKPAQVTVAELANGAYREYLYGDEVRSEQISSVLKDFAQKSLVETLVKSLADQLQPVMDTVSHSIIYDPPVKDLLHKYESSGLLGSFGDGAIKGMVGKSLADTLKSLKYDKAKTVVEKLFGVEFVKNYVGKADTLAMNALNGMSGEDQEEYKKYAYKKDNNTLLEVNFIAREKTDAEKNTPVAKAVTTEEGKSVDARAFVANWKDLTNVKSAAFAKVPDFRKVGEQQVVVEITYADGSKDKVEATLTVTKKEEPVPEKTDAEKNTPVAKAVEIEEGKSVEAKAFVANWKDLINVKSAAFVNAPDFRKIGEQQVVVEITYVDGSKDKVETTLTVSKKEEPAPEKTDAEKNTPVAKAVEIEEGKSVEAKAFVANWKDLINVKSAAFVNAPDFRKVGEQQVVVEITYVDGSKDKVETTLTVSKKEEPAPEKTDAEKNTPAAKAVEIEEGKSVEAKAFVANWKDLTNVKSAAFVIAPDFRKVGEQQVVVEITYADGSKDKVEATLTVTKKEEPAPEKTDAEKNPPRATNVSVEKGTAVAVEDFISNAKKLETMTAISYVNEPDFDKVGEQVVTVEVTYRDGSKAQVQAVLTILAKEEPQPEPEPEKTDAEKNTPVAKAVTTEEGKNVDARAFVANGKDLTNVETVLFVTAPDFHKVGEQKVTIEVRYKDGSLDRLEATLMVTKREEESKDRPLPSPQPKVICESAAAKRSGDAGQKAPSTGDESRIFSLALLLVAASAMILVEEKRKEER